MIARIAPGSLDERAHSPPAGLSGHLRFYHGKWREQLEFDVSHLAGLIPYREMPDDVPMLLDALSELDESDLLRFREWHQMLRALHDQRMLNY